MAGDADLLEYVLRLGDNALVLGQRCAELIGRAPQLEEEMAFANIGLDLLGQAGLLLAYEDDVEQILLRARRPLYEEVNRLRAALQAIAALERVDRAGFRDPSQVFLAIDRLASEALGRS